MNPAALGPALFTPPPTPDSGASTTAEAGTSAGDGGFARLLQPANTAAPTASATGDGNPAGNSGIEPAVAGSQALDSDPADSSDDAPWPPAGLETLLAAPATVTPVPAAVTLGLGTGVTADAQSLPASTAPLPTALSATTALPHPALRLPATPATAANAHSGLPATAASGVLASLADSSNLLADAVAPIADAALAAAGDDALASQLGANPTSLSLAAGGDSAPPASIAALVATGGASPLSASDTQASVLPTRADMGGEHFDQDVAEGVQYMLDNKLQSARIRISPQQLGMIEVELRLDGDRVHANFSSAQADVRQALNDSLPRLRELLDGQGLAMGDTAVGDHGQPARQDTDGSGHTPADSRATAGSQPSGGAAGSPAAGSWQRTGLLDAYA